jgi:hypothetical protein
VDRLRKDLDDTKRQLLAMLKARDAGAAKMDALLAAMSEQQKAMGALLKEIVAAVKKPSPNANGVAVVRDDDGKILALRPLSAQE